MRFARVVVALRFVLVPLWVAAAVAATLLLPSIDESSGGDLGDLLPSDAAVLEAERASLEAFPVPLRGPAVLVEHRPGGIPLERQRDAARRALALSGEGEGRVEGVAGALPATDALLRGRPLDGAQTILTTLFLVPDSMPDQWRAAEEAAAAVRGDPDATGLIELQPQGEAARLTGVVPARTAEAELILGRIHLVEAATALLVALLVGLHFRSVVAPLVTLATVGVAYSVASRLVGWTGEELDLAVPAEIRPVLVVLVFGVTTDYAIFLLAGFRRELGEGRDAKEAARVSLARLGGPVAAAGLAVVGATGVLAAARLELLSGFGPGMALAVLVALAVALTFVPCAAALLGRLTLWPRGAAESGRAEPRGLSARVATRHPRTVLVACFLVLGVGIAGLERLQLAEPMVSGLPADAEPRVAARAAAATLPAGVTQPTEVLVLGVDGARAEAAMPRLAAALQREPGVGLVFPPPLPVPVSSLLPEGGDPFVAGDAARLLLAWDSPPLLATAMGHLRDLEERLPGLAAQAGLPRDARVHLAGDTALAAATIDAAVDDLLRVGPLAVLAVVLVLVVLLRALYAPLYLVAAGLLSLAAALGAACWVFLEWQGQDGLSWLVPVAAGVLLVSLGADYTVFLAGRIWRRAERGGRLRDVVATEAAIASSPIRIAAIVLAASFALLALVPLRAFEQIAFTVAVGLLLDAFVVRSLLVPALLVLLGPGRRLRARAAAPG